MSIFYDALCNLVGDSNFHLIGDDKYENVVSWNVTNPPTEEQVNAEVLRLNDLEKNTEYQRLRAVQYPSITDQLDALYHAGVFPEEMAAKIKAVKDKYPKQ